jgi:hypothetical protein
MKDSYLCSVNEKDEICGLPERQKLPAREASVSQAEPK